MSEDILDLEAGRRFLHAKKIPYNMVELFDGKRSPDLLYTRGLSRCDAALIYIPSAPEQGILTHYPQVAIQDHVKKLEELSKGINTDSIRGVLLTFELGEHAKILSETIDELFDLDLSVIAYGSSGNLDYVHIDPHNGMWTNGRSLFDF